MDADHDISRSGNYCSGSVIMQGLFTDREIIAPSDTQKEEYSRSGYFSFCLQKMLAEACGVVLIETQLSC
jgi:hypothetical protein